MPVNPENANVNGGATFELIPEGMYTVQVVDISFKPKEEQKAGKYEPKDKYIFRLGVLEEKHRNKPLWISTTLSFTGGWTSSSGEQGSPSKLYELACAIYGEKLDPKKGLEDVNVLIGGQFRAIVKHNNEWANVVEVLKADEKLPELTDDEIKIHEPKEKEEGDEEISFDDLNLDLD